MKKIIFLLLFSILFFPKTTLALEPQNDYDTVTLSNCVDANSARFMLGNTEIKVKFLGIESAMTIHSSSLDEIHGSFVSDYVCSVLTNADDIKIEYEPNSDREDKYGRLLVWVYVDGVLLQENLVRLGYSKIAYLYDNYTYNTVLKEAENKAKTEKLGIWQEEDIVDTNVSSDDLSVETKEKNLFSTILNFINEIFEKFLKFIDDLMNNML